MRKKPIKIEIVQDGEERALVKIFDDGTKERTPIVPTRKGKTIRPRPYWYWALGNGRRKFF